MKTLAECARAYCEAKIEAAALVKTIRECESIGRNNPDRPGDWIHEPCYKRWRYYGDSCNGDTKIIPMSEWCENCRDSELRVMPRLRVLRRSMGGLVRAMMAAHSREAVCRAAGFEGRGEG